MTDDVASRLTAALSDRYRIERELGAGGMATVFLAHDIKHDRKVAVKVLRPELAAVIGAERFLAEIKTTANLQHPHILPLHDSGEVNGTVFYVMPFVEGESLRDRLTREKQLAIADAVRLTTEIAGALDYAHRHGVIHRDIKPENILLHDGQALVADFGIALAASKAEGGTRMTETGMSLGTPHYMSPEQAMGERNLDARTDVYALGCVLYEMLTGEPPFNGPTAQAIVAKVMTEKPTAPSVARDTVPDVVEDAVLTALAKLPVDRFTSAAEFATALTARGATLPLTRARTNAAVPAPGFSRSLAGWAVAGVALAVALWGWLRPIERRTSRFIVGFARGQSLDVIPDGTHLALSHDGSAMVYLGGDSGGSRLWLKRKDEITAVAIPGTEGAYDPFFSPDGREVGFFNEAGGRSFYRVSLSGGLPQPVYRGQLGTSGATWASDGYIYFDADAGGVQRIRPNGSGREVVMALDSANAEIGYAWPQLIADNQVILARLRHRSDKPEDFDVVAYRLKSKERVTVIRGVLARYLAGNLLVVTADGTLQSIPFDEGKLATTGQPVVLATGLRVAGTYAGVNLAVSDGGTLLYVAGPAGLTSHLDWVGSDGVETSIDSTWNLTALIREFALSPDGGRVAVSLGGAGFTGTDIWIKHLTTRTFTRLTVDPAFDRTPAWSADGRSVYFISDRISPRAAFRRRADGLGDDSLVMQSGGDLAAVAESPDGRWLLATEVDSGTAKIVAAHSADRTAPRPLITGPGDKFNGTLSPDGRWMAYAYNNSGRPEVFVRPFPDVGGGLWQVSVNGGIEPRWSHSGRSLYFLDPGRGTILVADIATTPTFLPGPPRVALRPAAGSGIMLLAGYDLSPDDRRFLVVSRDAANSESQLVRIENVLEELHRKKSQ